MLETSFKKRSFLYIFDSKIWTRQFLLCVFLLKNSDIKMEVSDLVVFNF